MYFVASKGSLPSSWSFIDSGISLLLPHNLHSSLSFTGTSSGIKPFSSSYKPGISSGDDKIAERHT